MIRRATQLLPRDQADRLRCVAGAAEARAFRIAVTAGKGGVGKTHLAVNLAARLAVANRKVALVDFDTGFASAEMLLDVWPQYDLDDVVTRRRNLDDIAVDAPCGVRLIAGGAIAAELSRADSARRDRLVEQLDAIEHTCDFVVFDCGSTSSRQVLSLAASADVILVVSTPDPIVITSAYAMIKALSGFKIHGQIRLVQNIVQSRGQAQQIHARIAETTRKFLNFALADGGYVLQDDAVGLAARGRKPLVLYDPRCPASVCLTAIAARCLRDGDAVAANSRGQALSRLVQLFL